jgi:hypothetical protein
MFKRLLEFPVISQMDILKELTKINVNKVLEPSPVNHIIMKKRCAFSKLFYNFFNMIRQSKNCRCNENFLC